MSYPHSTASTDSAAICLPVATRRRKPRDSAASISPICAAGACWRPEPPRGRRDRQRSDHHLEDAGRARPSPRDRQREWRLFVRTDEQPGFVGKFIPFGFTPTQFGGRRSWFACPGCGKGCRVLYGVYSLRGRQCRGLKYQSQYEMPAFRLLSRAQKIRRKLGQAAPLTGPLASKHRRLEHQVCALEEAGWRALSASLR
jgi:hypothetical protein